MGKKVDLTGQRFGRLVVICENGRTKCRNVMWLCKCDCGSEVTVLSNHLRNGHTSSCGCLAREKFAEISTKHGLSVSHLRLYNTVYGHFHKIKNEVGSYGDWQIDPRYAPDITGVIKFCEDLIALRPEECERYESDKSIEADKDNDQDRIFRPESITFVSCKENTNNRRCTLRMADGTSLAMFCHSLGIKTYNQADRKHTKQYLKYANWFTRHDGEGHPELLKKANDLILLYTKCFEMLKLRDSVADFKRHLTQGKADTFS